MKYLYIKYSFIELSACIHSFILLLVLDFLIIRDYFLTKGCKKNVFNTTITLSNFTVNISYTYHQMQKFITFLDNVLILKKYKGYYKL